MAKVAKKGRIQQKLSCLDSSIEGGKGRRNSRFYRSLSGWMNDHLIVSSQMFKRNFQKKWHFCAHHNMNINEILYVINFQIIQKRIKWTKTLNSRLKWTSL